MRPFPAPLGTVYVAARPAHADRILTSAALDRPVPEPEGPPVAKPPSSAKSAPPHAAVLGDAKITINALASQVFDALTNPERLGAWWGKDTLVEAEVGGRYEATLPVGRVDGTITAIDGPGALFFTWPRTVEGMSVVTSVHYQLTPMGPQTLVHVAHRAPRPVPGDWTSVWQSVLESLKAHVEATASP